jgi:hypothetical protein
LNSVHLTDAPAIRDTLDDVEPDDHQQQHLGSLGLIGGQDVETRASNRPVPWVSS